MTGGIVSMTVTKFVQKDLLPQQSTASQTTAMSSWQNDGVLVLMPLMKTLIPEALQQLSVAVAASVGNGEPHWMV